MTKQTAKVLVDQLEAMGYVERRADPTDGRARLVTFGQRGRRALRIARRVQAEIEAEWEAHLGARRAAQLRAALVSLREITDP